MHSDRVADFVFLEHAAASLGDPFPPFRRTILPSFSRNSEKKVWIFFSKINAGGWRKLLRTEVLDVLKSPYVFMVFRASRTS